MPPPRRRPGLEELEDRRLLALVVWTGADPARDSWFDGRNWNLRRAPRRGDDVLIARAGAVVRFDGGRLGEVEVRSILCSQKLVITGGTLAAQMSSVIDDLELSGGALEADGPLTLTGDVLWTGGWLRSDTAIDFRGRTVAAGNEEKEFDAPSISNFGFWAFRGGRIDGPDGAAFVNQATGIARLEGGEAFDLVVRNLGLWVVEAPGVLDVAGFVNLGSLTLRAGRLHTATFDQQSGDTLLAGGELASDRPASLGGGSLLGGGTIFGSLVNSGGRIAPGGVPLRVVGDFAQGPGGVIEEVLSGPADLGLFDRLIVSGTARLDGLLLLRVLLPLGPNNAYPVLTAGQVVGQFDNAGPLPLPGFTLVQRYELTGLAVVASVPPPPPRPDDDPEVFDDGTDPTTDPGLASRPELLANLAAGLTSLLAGTDAARQLLGGVRAVTAVALSGGGAPLGTLLSGGEPVSPGLSRGAASGGDRGASGGGPDPGGTGEEEQAAAFVLSLPDLELPAQEEALVARDLAKAMLLGGRTRSALLPQGGSQGAVIATRIAGDDGQADEATDEAKSPYADLLISPLPRRLPSPQPVEDAAPPPEDEPLAALWEEPDGWALTLAAVGGMVAWLAERRQRKLCSGPGNEPSLTSRQ